MGYVAHMSMFFFVKIKYFVLLCIQRNFVQIICSAFLFFNGYKICMQLFQLDHGNKYFELVEAQSYLGGNKNKILLPSYVGMGLLDSRRAIVMCEK